MSKAKIKTATETLVEDIRAHVRGHVKLWQLVPALALKADGRTGFNDNYRVAYNCGIWMLRTSISNGYYNVAVDCSDGALVNPFFYLEKGLVKPAHEYDVLLMTKGLDELDATSVVSHLRSRSKEPISKLVMESNQDWFENVRPSIKVPHRFGTADREAALAKRKKSA